TAKPAKEEPKPPLSAEASGKAAKADPSSGPSAAMQEEAKKELDEHLVERRKEAQARLDEVKKELAQERKDAEQLAQATRARLAGSHGVHRSWDFHEAKQLEDFTGGLTLTGKSVTLDTPRKLSVFFMGGTSSGSDDNPLGFVGILTANLKLTSDGPVTFHLFAGAAGGYEIDLGPSGAQLLKIDPKAGEKDRRKSLATSETAK